MLVDHPERWEAPECPELFWTGRSRFDYHPELIKSFILGGSHVFSTLLEHTHILEQDSCGFSHSELVALDTSSCPEQTLRQQERRRFATASGF